MYYLQVITAMSSTPAEQYFKITNQEEKHFDHQYKTGLNTLNKPFSDSKLSCDHAGLYFTTKRYLHRYYTYGVWLREISFPKKQSFKMVRDPSGDKWRANIIVLEGKHALFDINTVRKFDLLITEEYVQLAVCHGNLELLQYLFTNHFELIKRLDKRTLLENAITCNKLDNAKFIDDHHPEKSYIYLSFVVSTVLRDKNKNMVLWLVNRKFIKKTDMALIKHRSEKDSAKFVDFIESCLKD